MEEFSLPLVEVPAIAPAPSGDQHFKISALAADEEEYVVNIVRRNLDSFEEAGSVLAASFRRLEDFVHCYSQPGSVLLVIKDLTSNKPVGCVGLGPLAGLPPAEGIGEIRELVVEKPYRQFGLGRRLLDLCLRQARELGYRRIYLETTPQMKNAQKLFLSFGFRPVISSKEIKKGETTLPCYYMLDGLENI